MMVIVMMMRMMEVMRMIIMGDDIECEGSNQTTTYAIHPYYLYHNYHYHHHDLYDHYHHQRHHHQLHHHLLLLGNTNHQVTQAMKAVAELFEVNPVRCVTSGVM